MAQTTVVVTFSSRCGATEALAHAAAVGAVQGRALIRLRRLDDGTPARDGESPECQETLRRMRKEYVPPTDADLTGNDALVLVPPAGSTTATSDWAGLLARLTALAGQDKLSGLTIAVVDTGDAGTTRAFSELAARCGVELVRPEPQASLAATATAHGRLVALRATARKAAPR